MSGISNELREFLQGWLAWVEDGAPDSRDFNRCQGLCIQPCLRDCDLIAELDELLIKTRGTNLFPFNRDNIDYWEGVDQATHHLNEDRINWVREVLRHSSPSSSVGRRQ